MLEGFERVIAIQGEAVHRDFVRDADTNCGNFHKLVSVIDPHSRSSVDPLALHSELGDDINKSLF